jgi:hypothetical protein
MNWKALCLIASLALTASLSACAGGGSTDSQNQTNPSGAPAAESGTTGGATGDTQKNDATKTEGAATDKDNATKTEGAATDKDKATKTDGAATDKDKATKTDGDAMKKDDATKTEGTTKP